MNARAAPGAVEAAVSGLECFMDETQLPEQFVSGRRMVSILDLAEPDAEPAASSDPACVASVVAFHFEHKREQVLSLAQARHAMQAGQFVWIDILAEERAEASRVLQSFGLLDEEVIDAALVKEPSTQHARYDAYVHLVVSECHALGNGFELRRLDVVLAERLFLTIHRTPIAFLAALRRAYKGDFVRFAKSPSFLVYEIWDHLLDSYLSVQKVMEERVEQLQNELRSEHVADNVFSRISELGSDLLHFRKIVLPARTVLSDLATRRSLFLSETTQGFLANMVGTVEHVLQDLLVDRDILSESLNLYMSLVGHRTNEVMKRLTVVSVVFLPLTFLCGVYGMNFEILPELHWPYGYAFFWSVALAIVVILLSLMRRSRLI
jgi:magnesium transporter